MKYFPIVLLIIGNLLLRVNSTQAQENIIKVAPIKLAIATGAFAYERVLSDQLSVGIHTHIRFRTNLGERVLTFINDRQSNNRFSANQLSLGGTTFTPELRYYPGGEAPRGFYLNPFVRILTYKSILETSYTGDFGDVTEVESKIRLLTGGPGFSIGYQFLIGDQWTIDWHGGLGLTVGIVRHTGTVTNGAIQTSIQDIVDEANLFIEENLPINWQLNLQDEVSLRFTAPGAIWPVVRSSLSVGYAF